MNLKNKENNGRNIISQKGCSLILVVAGCLLLGFNLGLIPAELKPIILSWQMLLIAIGVFSLMRGRRLEGAILIVVGSFFLMPSIGSEYSNLYNLYWPLLLILLGALFFFKKTKQPSVEGWLGQQETEKYTEYNDADQVKKNVLFSGVEQVVFSSNFKGGDLNVAFGEIKLDLRRVSYLAENNKMEANVMFGNIIIYLPSGWRLNISSDNFFGSVQDNRGSESVGSTESNLAPVLNLKCAVMFGSIELR